MYSKTDEEIIKEIGNQIEDIADWHPRQLMGLFSFIKHEKPHDIINIVFTEEIKDGRSSRFNLSNPLELINKTFVAGDFKIKITRIVFRDQIDQPSDYNRYVDYYYQANIMLV